MDQMLDFKDTSVVFVTIDSCTLETALNAKTINLNKISKTFEAETNSTFTYPAHQAFFAGHLPMLIDNKFFAKYKYIWRSATARKNKDVKALMIFDNMDIVKFYKDLNFNVLGYGGVGFFNSYSLNTSLPKLFDKFIYFGLKEFPNPDYPRPAKTFPLNNIDKILSDINKSNRPFFLFINSIATHIPYDIPDTVFSKKYLELITRLYKEHYQKRRYELNKIPFTTEEIYLLKSCQIKALEWVDIKIGQLIAKLPKNRPILFIACSDHGEEFGEGGRFGHDHFHSTVMKVPLWYGILP